MEVEKAIKDRRSVRKYDDKDVDNALIMECLDAGRYAPSSGNLQNWRFVIVKNKELKEKIVKLCNRQYWALNAPALIIICAELKRAKRMYGSKGEELYSVQNCAAATENIMLRAQELGLCTGWIGAFDENAVGEEIRVEEGNRVVTILALGYGKSFSVLRREPLENFVFFEQFGNKDRDLRNIPLEKAAKQNIGRVKDLMERFKRKREEKKKKKEESKEVEKSLEEKTKILEEVKEK